MAAHATAAEGTPAFVAASLGPGRRAPSPTTPAGGAAAAPPSPAIGAVSVAVALLADVALALDLRDTATARQLVAEAARLAPADSAVGARAGRLLGRRWRALAGVRAGVPTPDASALPELPVVEPAAVTVDTRVRPSGLPPKR